MFLRGERLNELRGRPRTAKARRIGLILIGIVVLGGVLAMRIEGIRWRVHVLALHATGQIPDLSFGDLLYMVKPGSGYFLEPLMRNRSPYQTIANPFAGLDASEEKGRELFLARCAACHGADGSGGEAAPALAGRPLTRGGSDWALFRTIRYGIPNTAMAPHGLPHEDVWHLVSFVRSLENHGLGEGMGSAHALADRNLSVSRDDLLAAARNTSDWLMFGGSYSSQRFTALTSINRDNVSRIAVQWIHQLSELGDDDRIVATPLVRDGIVFVTSPPGTVLAMDGSTGDVLWQWKKQLPEHVMPCCGFVNRGVALAGDRLIVGTLDAHLVALEARTGRQIWDATVANYREGYAVTGAPLVVGDIVVTGIGGGDYPTRGFIDAYDLKTGERRWRFNTIPGPGEPGHETWPGETWRTGGGASWSTGSYDPQLDLIYWGVGNPVPNHTRSARSGDNLYTNSVVALNAKTGKLAWHYQFTPNDDHDWDSVQTPVLADLPIDGQMRQLLLFANRNAFYYVLDRTNGQFIRAVPFAQQTWAKEIGADGRPVLLESGKATPEGTLVYPSAMGATNWWPPSFSPAANLFYIPTLERPGIFFSARENKPETGVLYPGGYTMYVPEQPFYTAVRALDPVTGELKWEYRFAPRTRVPSVGGLLSTAGGLLFGSDQGTFFALDSDSGRMLWKLETGANISAPPVTFSHGGRQFILITAGRALLALSLPATAGQ
jgi:alcohol dehydrogenase (cytochrome c)